MTRIRPAIATPRAEPSTAGSVELPGGTHGLRGRFVLKELLASGGMGHVYRAEDRLKLATGDQEPFLAVKVLHEDFRSHPDAWIALQRETKRAQQLAHPNIVTVYDFDQDGDEFFMTMELLEGQSLAEFLRVHPGPQDFAAAFPIIEGIGNALAYAHKKGVVHSDMKPGNVFLTHKGEVKVLDFGIARVIRDAGEQDGDTFDAASFGALSPAYASCEIIEHAPPDPRDDIYAVACMAYQLLTGRHPFGRMPATDARDSGKTPARPAQISARQWKTLLRGLAFERAARTANVEDFLHGLRPWQLSRRLRRGLAAGLSVVTLAGGIEAYRAFAIYQAELQALALLEPLENAGAARPALIAQAGLVHAALIAEPLRGRPQIQLRAGEVVERLLLRQAESVLRGDWAPAELDLKLAETLNADDQVAAQLVQARKDLESARTRRNPQSNSAGGDAKPDGSGNLHRKLLALANRFERLPLSLTQPVYYPSQPIGVALETPVAGALHVFHVTADGKARLLFSNGISRDHHVDPGIHKLPKSPRVEFSSGTTPGKSVLLAVLDPGEKPVNLYERNRTSDGSSIAELSADEVLDFLESHAGNGRVQAGAAEMMVCEKGAACDWNL